MDCQRHGRPRYPTRADANGHLVALRAVGRNDQVYLIEAGKSGNESGEEDLRGRAPNHHSDIVRHGRKRRKRNRLARQNIALHAAQPRAVEHHDAARVRGPRRRYQISAAVRIHIDRQRGAGAGAVQRECTRRKYFGR